MVDGLARDGRAAIGVEADAVAVEGPLGIQGGGAGDCCAETERGGQSTVAVPAVKGVAGFCGVAWLRGQTAMVDGLARDGRAAIGVEADAV